MKIIALAVDSDKNCLFVKTIKQKNLSLKERF